MASITGGQFHSANESAPGSSSNASAGHLSFASVADFHSTVGGTGSTGFDSVSGTSGGDLAGQGGSGSSDSFVATQTSGGNTVIHLPDGSSLTVVGTTHLDGGFLH